MREKMRRFMWGRYGSDRFNQFLMLFAMVFLFISFFGGGLFYIWATVLLVYSYYRMFSRNVARRTAENQWYLKQEGKVRNFFVKKKKEWGQRKVYRIYKCPNCRQKLRVPKGKGRISIRCGKCGDEFIRKS